ncbi:MAG: bacillithiol biosynthesis cysteine-adding enzyme BshC [Acidobacteriales bacterium]|nr:bacillithiol biosynthesis cysteine-adding enzyme BshC [Terriglobales bacterium]
MNPDCLPFSALPHTPRLFTDFTASFARVQAFYPHPPQVSETLQRRPELNYDSERRERVSTVLERQNRSWGASQVALDNLARLRRGAEAMVTGQQVALFGGPLYSIYKALSTIKLAEQLTQAGRECVPVFWLATEDHDFAEVSQATLFSNNKGLIQLALESLVGPNRPVSEIRLGGAIAALLQPAQEALGQNEITDLLRSCYAPQETLGSAFAKLFTKLFSKFGLIILDPSDPDLHRIAAPLYQAAIKKSESLVQALLERGSQIEAAGYEPQVKVTNSSTLLFRLQNEERLAIRRSNGGFIAGTEKLTTQQLMEEIASHPERFSPNVLLRPVTQDFLLPTVAYIGGPSEVAYFAQANVVYQHLLGRVTAILPRFSATLIDPKSRRIMEQYGVTITEVLQGPERVRERLAEQHLPKELESTLESTQRELEKSLSHIVAQLKKLDSTLVDAAEKSVSKVEYQLDHLKKKAAHAQLRRRDELRRHADHLSDSIYPNKNLQEREIAGISFLAQHGPALLERLYEAVQPNCLGHQLVQI